MRAPQPGEDDAIVMTDALARRLLRHYKPKHVFDFRVPLVCDECLSKDWTPRAGDFSLHFDREGIIYRADFDGQRWQRAASTLLSKKDIEERVNTGKWELVEYSRSMDMPRWYVRDSK